jgi:hypothetical protein
METTMKTTNATAVRRLRWKGIGRAARLKVVASA